MKEICLRVKGLNGHEEDHIGVFRLDVRWCLLALVIEVTCLGHGVGILELELVKVSGMRPFL